MRFLPQAYSEFKPPATYRLWRRPGLADYLPFWFAVMAPPIGFEAWNHHLGKVLELLAVAAAVLAAMAFVPAGRLGKPAAEIIDDVLTVRMRFYIPTRTARLPLGELRQVTITGPSGNRDWIFAFAGGSRRELRPYFGDAMDDVFAMLLRTAAKGRFAVIVKAPCEPEP